MNQEHFLTAIYADITDDLPKHIFADWLEEQGHEVEARVLRLSIEVKANPDPIACAHIIHGVLDKIVKTPWQNSLMEIGRFRTLHRRVFMPVPQLNGDFAATIAVAPDEWYGCEVVTIAYGRIDADLRIDWIAEHPAFRRVTQLNLTDWAESVVGHFSLLHTFQQRYLSQCSNTQLTRAGVERLLESPLASRLQELRLTGDLVDGDAYEPLLKKNGLRSDVRLELSDNVALGAGVRLQLQTQYPTVYFARRPLPIMDRI